ncbi:MAG: sulfur carrier protein ThiS [Pseudomonadota bacterium]
MQIIVNGTAHSTGAGTLAALVEELGHDAAVVATALNGDFAPRGARAATPLAEGDRVEILAPMQGG